jgi:phytoene dehydrogenase-like protein
VSFVESVSILDRLPAEIGLGAATCFYCTEERFAYRRPDGLIDPRSGVLSIPNNFAATRPLREGVVRLTVLGSHPRWSTLAPSDYAAAKERAADDALRGAATFFPNWSPHTVFRDVFTPTTVERFTGHAGGAIYGSPRKRLDGATGFEGLGLCGTDQGFLGIVGALLSGIAMANRHALSPAKL